MKRELRLAYLAITRFGSCLSGKVEVHDNLLLLLHFLLLFHRLVSTTVQSAIVVAGIEVLVIKLSSRGAGRSSAIEYFNSLLFHVRSIRLVW
jgi:hypothetical protein